MTLKNETEPPSQVFECSMREHCHLEMVAMMREEVRKGFKIYEAGLVSTRRWLISVFGVVALGSIAVLVSDHFSLRFHQSDGHPGIVQAMVQDNKLLLREIKVNQDMMRIDIADIKKNQQTSNN